MSVRFKSKPAGNSRLHLRKMALTGLLAAASLLLSGVSFPVGPTRCYPFQHTANVLAGAILGPWWAAVAAFITSLLRNMAGTGTIFAFPGGIPGAIAAGLAFRRFKRPAAALAEPFGTGVLGAAISAWILGPAMGTGAGFSALAGAFLISSGPGALIGMALVHILQKTPLARVLEIYDH